MTQYEQLIQHVEPGRWFTASALRKASGKPFNEVYSHIANALKRGLLLRTPKMVERTANQYGVRKHYRTWLYQRVER